MVWRVKNGITLVALVITVFVMLIIVVVSLYSGTESLNSTRLKGFYTQLEIVQKRVDDIAATNEKYVDKEGQEIEIKEKGQSLTQNQKDSLRKILQVEGIPINNINIEEFKYFKVQDIEEILDLREIEYNLFINFEDRIIIAEDGITIEGKTYYVLKNAIYFVETDISKNDIEIVKLKYSTPIKYIKDSYRVTIIPDNIIGDLKGSEYVKYKNTNTKYWETSYNNEIIIQKDVEYNIKYCYSNKSIEKIIKIDYEKDEEGNLIEDEEGNNKLTVVEIKKNEESGES